ncbi:hypothetical protein [Azovibrio restrictus]|nr:hypothetical protein [Azovibrio restrictus]
MELAVCGIKQRQLGLFAAFLAGDRWMLSGIQRGLRLTHRAYRVAVMI